MSTRARTRSAAAAAAAVAAVAPQVEQPSPAPKVEKKQTKGAPSTTTQSVVQSESDQQQEKENVDSNSSKGLKSRAKPKSKTQPTRKVSEKPSSEVHCLCKSSDDGTPMVQCGQCNVWYHFRCVDLKEEHAEDISVYICPSCVTSSGLRTTMTWEGPEAFEGGEPERKVSKKQPPAKRIKRKTPAPLPSSESEADPSSEDEYVLGSKNKLQGAGKRPTRQLSASSESDSELSADAKPRRHRIRKVSSASPVPSGSLKRKNIRRDSSTPAPPPLPKRRKSDAVHPTDDPTRKYCLGKLEALFQDIFSRYPHIRTQTVGESTETSLIQKPLGDLTEEEKAELLGQSKQFADDLEKCIFETYSEPDKQGQSSAGGQYKDRFRTLQFNLSKVDRVVIHKRIASAEITPKEISTMSSADLANEEMKQSIKIAEKEALEYSILTPTAVPRAKITHKGLEDIENVHGSEVTTLQDEERSRKEEEEKRERERMARLRSQRTSSISVPPESPIVTQQPWGGPPPVPTHSAPLGEVVMSPTTAFVNERSPVTSSYPHHVSDPTEPELNLADFINMDEEVTAPAADAPSKDPSSANQPDVAMESPAGSPTIKAPELSATSPTAMSPFAQKPDNLAAFDLSSLWSASRKSPDPQPSSPKVPVTSETGTTSRQVASEKDVNMDAESGAADDLDFDMFLEEKDLPANSAEAQQAALDALHQVWTGKITMPLDSTVPQDTSVVARQVGGRHLDHDSLLWKTLFPAESLRIEGRVPVENSSKFLLQMRMNVAKELVAVAFSPVSESNDATFRILSDFLIAKKRHGLIFPWGNRSKDHLPGRELYIIPLLSSDPLPEYMELLDDLRLPKLRKKNLLIGIFVLTKGKLTSPPTALPLPSLGYAPPAISQVPLHPSPFPPVPIAPPPPPPPPSTLPANIAAEVATLTPEQIQLMIQTLTNNGAVPLSIPQSPSLQHQPPPPPGIPPHPPAPYAAPPPPPGQPWSGPTPGYGGAFSPPPVPVPAPSNSPNAHNQPRSPGPMSWDRPSRHDRGGRGWQGGRGRGYGRLHDASDRPPVDSGWPRRSRNDNGDASSSPVRRWS